MPDEVEVPAVSVPAPTDFQKWEKAPEVETPETPAVAAVPAQEAKPAPDSDPDDIDQEPGEDEPEKPQTQRGINRKFAKMSGKIRDLEAKLAAKPAAAEVKPGIATPPAVDPNAPKIADFEDYEKYLDARTDYRVAQTEKTRAAEAAEAANAEAWTAASKDAREKYDDFDEIVNQDIPISRAVNDAIQESPVRAELAYFLGKNPDEVKRINALSPTRAGAEIAKIEATFAAATPEAKKPAVSNAPKPAKPVSGSSAADAGKEPDPKDFAKWSKWKDRQEALEA